MHIKSYSPVTLFSIRRRLPRLGVFFIFAGIFYFSTETALALKVREHPIHDLIEGDKRTPPEGEHIIEERPATPAYPLPNTGEFKQATALETFPAQPMDGEAMTTDEGFSDWDDWSSWDSWTELDEQWDDWDDKTDDADVGHEENWDDWFDEGQGEKN